MRGNFITRFLKGTLAALTLLAGGGIVDMDCDMHDNDVRCCFSTTSNNLVVVLLFLSILVIYYFSLIVHHLLFVKSVEVGGGVAGEEVVVSKILASLLGLSFPMKCESHQIVVVTHKDTPDY